VTTTVALTRVSCKAWPQCMVARVTQKEYLIQFQNLSSRSSRGAQTRSFTHDFSITAVRARPPHAPVALGLSPAVSSRPSANPDRLSMQTRW
jgi:hypothetical protein